MLLPVAQHVFESCFQCVNPSVITSNMVFPTLEMKDVILVCPWQGRQAPSFIITITDISRAMNVPHSKQPPTKHYWETPWGGVNNVAAELTSPISICKTNETCSEEYKSTIIITDCIWGKTRSKWQLFRHIFSVIWLPIINKLQTPFHEE
jgi:hypothetical protein